MIWKKIPSKKKSIEGYTLDKVNHLHSRVKQYLSKFKGISYKFLQGYITMFQMNELYKSCAERNWKYEVFASLMSFKTTLRCAHIDKGLVEWTV